MEIDWVTVGLMIFAFGLAVIYDRYLDGTKDSDEETDSSADTEEEDITTMDIDSVGEQLREIITEAAAQAAGKGVAISTSFQFTEHIQYNSDEQDKLNVTISATPNEARVQALLSALKAAKTHIITLQGDDRATNRADGDAVKHAVLDIIDAAIKS